MFLNPCKFFLHVYINLRVLLGLDFFLFKYISVGLKGGFWVSEAERGMWARDFEVGGGCGGVGGAVEWASRSKVCNNPVALKCSNGNY